MKVLIAVIGLFVATMGYCQDKQTELDQQCEDARQIALAPLKQNIFEECLEQGKKESVCQSEADEYNGARANRGPMFYDLPECEEAFNYKKNHGSS